MSSPSSSDHDLPVPSKPWSSGRVMTAAQRERKRRVDRLKQKERRLQTSQLVDDLKAQVESLTNKLAKLESGTAAISSTSVDATSLAEVPLATRSLNTAFQPDLTVMGDGVDITPYPVLPTNNDRTLLFPSVCPPMSSTCLENLLNNTSQVGCLGSEMSIHPEYQYIASSFQPVALDSPSFPHQQQQLSEQRNSMVEHSVCPMQNTVNNLMRRGCMTAKQYICTSEQLNQDALIRGIVQGWSSVDSLPYHCPLWTIIKQMDESFFSNSSVITRFCTLRMSHYVLLVCRAFGFCGRSSSADKHSTSQVQFPNMTCHSSIGQGM